MSQQDYTQPTFSTDPILKHYPDLAGTVTDIRRRMDEERASLNDYLTLRSLAPHLGGDVVLLEAGDVPESYAAFPVVWTLIDLLTNDIFTDAPEYAGTVERVRAMVSWLQDQAVDGPL